MLGKANDNSYDTGDVLFIPDYNKLYKNGISAVSAIYDLKRIKNGHIPIRIVNPINCKKTLYSGMSLGKLVLLSDVMQVESNNNLESDGLKPKEDILKEMIDNHKHMLTNKELSELIPILNEFGELFSRSSTDLGCIKGFKHRIYTNHHPIAIPSRKVAIHLEDKVENLIKDLLKKDIIKESTSPWNSPIVVVPKKDGGIRMCIDYRKLNAVTERPIFPIPDSKQLFDCLGGCNYFSALDLSMGYHQLKMDDQDIDKTAFTTRTGQYTFQRMPFGLCNAPASFQNVLCAILRDFNWKSCLIYLDDLLIFGKTLTEHNERLREVLSALLNAGIKLSPFKCSFLQKSVKYLGHIIDKRGISTDPDKIEKIKCWPTPQTNKELHTFIGLCGYYRKFINQYAKIVKPLEELLAKSNKKNSKFMWTDEYTICFNQLKNALTSAPVISFPNRHDTYVLDTDASAHSTGAVLSQIQQGEETVIAYASHTLSKHERQYCATRRELLAVYRYVKYFHHYLFGKRFIIRTDHRALTWVLNWNKPSTSQYCSWIAELEQYNFEIQHRSGQKHQNADALSRYPDCGQCELSHDEPMKKRNVKQINSIRINDSSNEYEKLIECIRLDSFVMYSELQKNGSRRTKQILRFKESLLVEENKLFCKMNGKKLHIPEPSKRINIIEQCHIRLCHLGFCKCLSRLKMDFYWPGMNKDTENVILSCDACQKYKHDHTRKQPYGSLNGTCSFETIAVDITGPFKKSTDGYSYILGVIDHFSKYPMLIPLKQIDSQTIIKSLNENWFNIFGIPNRIHSDRGMSFESSLFKNMCSFFNIKKTASPAYHPQSDGIIERLFKTIKPMIAILTKEENIDWPNILGCISSALRNTKTNTHYSPNEIIFGKNFRDSYATYVDNDVPNITVDEYMKTTQVNRQKYVRELSKENTDKRIISDANFSPHFRSGQNVLIRIQGKSSGDQLFDGPFKIIRSIGKRMFEIQLRNGKTTVRSGQHIKAYHYSSSAPKESENEIRKRKTTKYARKIFS